jgi:hypothetical protein
MISSPAPESLVALAEQLTPLLEEVRNAVADRLFGPGNNAVNNFLHDAPVGVCVRLHVLWEAALQSDLPLKEYLDTLSPEHRFILDVVAAIYSGTDASETSVFPDYRRLI